MNILVVGSLRRGEFEAIHQAGYKIGLILDEIRHTTVPAGLEPLCVETHDFSLPIETLIQKIESLHRICGFSVLLNLREHYVRATSQAAHALGFAGLPVETIDGLLNKTQMREKLIAGLGAASVPRFQNIQNYEELRLFVAEVGFPIVLKPAQLYGSLFVEKIHNESELEESYHRSRQALTDYCQRLSLKDGEELSLQAEEFLSGTVHSIDVLVDSNGRGHLTPVVDVLTANDFGVADFSHWIRHALTRLPEEVQIQMNEMALHAVRYLGIRNAVAHVEFIYGNNGPRLLEVAARPGGHRNRVLSSSYGIELNLALVRALEKKSVNLHRGERHPFAIVTPFPTKSRRLRASPSQSAQHLSSFAYAEQKSQPGALIGPAHEGYASSLVVELAHTDSCLLLAEAYQLASEGEHYL